VTPEVPPCSRLVALGASNLTRGFHAVVATARDAWGHDVEVLAALGHGRSYGAPSQFLIRTLPGILESGIFRHLATRPAAPTRALVTDVGNDILYGYGADRTLSWVREAVDRLQAMTGDIVLTDLPMASIRRLSNPAFLVVRSILVPSCRLTRREVVDAAERLNDGLVALAAERGLRLVRLNPDWYGVDPIHMRPAIWNQAWQEIVRGHRTVGPASTTPAEGWRLYFKRPECQWLFGRQQNTPQVGERLGRGGRLWLF
jgi:hypothetical protein